MTGKQKFFICKHCGNLIGLIDGKGVPVVCCGENMQELIPNTTKASTEKHLPVVSFADGKLDVTIGSVPHPTEDIHHIAFVYVETKHGGQRKILSPGQEPKLSFSFTDDKPVAVFAYCNLHGLWKTKID